MLNLTYTAAYNTVSSCGRWHKLAKNDLKMAWTQLLCFLRQLFVQPRFLFSRYLVELPSCIILHYVLSTLHMDVRRLSSESCLIPVIHPPQHRTINVATCHVFFTSHYPVYFFSISQNAHHHTANFTLILRNTPYLFDKMLLAEISTKIF